MAKLSAEKEQLCEEKAVVEAARSELEEQLQDYTTETSQQVSVCGGIH